MLLEAVDGSTALAIGPEVVRPSEYMAAIWGTKDGTGPMFDGAEQAQFVMDLLARHWNTIAVRLQNECLPTPLLLSRRPQSRARAWADGFVSGVLLHPEDWEAAWKSKKAARFLLMIVALCDTPQAKEHLTPEDRGVFVDALPTAIMELSLFWRADEQPPLPRLEPVRSVKVGRNEPCPCGSGRKYKKCCGAGSATPIPL